jgi:tRNA(Ile)-lysidine synthase
LSRRALPKQVWVRGRAGGESIALQAAGGRRRVKALLREAHILPWWRERVPLIGVDDEVIAVADLFIAARYRASGDEPARDRLRLVWERPSDWQVPID